MLCLGALRASSASKPLGVHLILAYQWSRTWGQPHPLGHRYGLCLTDNGNAVSWTLDGEVMDIVDITGFFQSSPEAMQDGAYASICMAGSYQSNVWKHSDARIYVSR